jgi:ABC-type protease/lipase transport system fused ATPase/permease subunit
MGLIGPTAVGKTTLGRLLVGVIRPYSGHIRLDGADLWQWDSDALGRYIGYVPQTVELFSGTVRENIARMGEGDAEAVIAAAKLAGVHETVLRLPQGYETDIGESGSMLSGGQRQRIALARACYGDPRLLVLDEPNANLDQNGEEALLQAMARLKEAKITCIVIAHRPSVLRRVDKVLYLGPNCTARFGTPEEILPSVTMMPKETPRLAATARNA